MQAVFLIFLICKNSSQIPVSNFAILETGIWDRIILKYMNPYRLYIFP